MIRDGRAQRTRDERRGSTWPFEVICPWDECSLGPGIGGISGSNGAVAYPSANTAYFIPFILEQKFVVQKAFMESAANGSGSVDWGIYDHSYTYINSVGSTVWVSQADIQTATLSQTLTPGRYFMAFAASSTGIGIQRFQQSFGDGSPWRMFGVVQKASAFPLPTGTVAPAAYAVDFIPFIGLMGQTVI